MFVLDVASGLLYLLTRTSTDNGGEFDDFVCSGTIPALLQVLARKMETATPTKSHLASVRRRMSRFPAPWVEAKWYSRRVQES
jgi:hypothetical protein